MSKKSLFYIGAGALLILMAVLTFFESALTFSSTMYPYFEKAQLSFKMFEMDGFFRYFMKEGMNFLSWANIILLALAGIVLLVKAFMPDLVPNIALGGIFGLLALLALIAFFRDFINMFRSDGTVVGKAIVRQDFSYYVGYCFSLLVSLLTLVAFGGMATIIILKDSFGSFFFVPAAAAGVGAVISFFINLGVTYSLHIWAYTTVWTFGASLLFFLIDCVLVAALFAAGLANNEE